MLSSKSSSTDYSRGMSADKQYRPDSLGFFFLNGSISWRFPLAFQIVFAIMVMGFLLMIPESPAWLIKHSDRYPEFRREGKATLARIYATDEDDDHINGLVDAMDSAAAQVAKSRFQDIFTHGPTQARPERVSWRVRELMFSFRCCCCCRTFGARHSVSWLRFCSKLRGVSPIDSVGTRHWNTY